MARPGEAGKWSPVSLLKLASLDDDDEVLKIGTVREDQF